MLSTGCIFSFDSQTSETKVSSQETGEIAPVFAWSDTITDAQVGSVYVEGEYIYFEILVDGTPTRVKAYDLASHQTLWAISETTNTYLLSGNGKLFLLNERESVLSAISIQNAGTVWQIPLPTQGYDYEIAFGGDTLFLGVGNSIYALNAIDGHLLWQYSLPSGFRINTAWLGTSNVYRDYDALSYYDGILYVRAWLPNSESERNGSLLAIDVVDGEEKWRFSFDLTAPMESPPWMIASQPAFWENLLFFGDWEGQVYLLDKDTGEMVWQANTGFPIVRPLMVDERVYVVTDNGLFSLDSETGKELWSTPLTDLTPSSPMRVAGDRLLFVANDWQKRQVWLVLADLENGELSRELEIASDEDCRSCIAAFEIQGDKIYIVQQQTIISISLITSQH